MEWVGDPVLVPFGPTLLSDRGVTKAGNVVAAASTTYAILELCTLFSLINQRVACFLCHDDVSEATSVRLPNFTIKGEKRVSPLVVSRRFVVVSKHSLFLP